MFLSRPTENYRHVTSSTLEHVYDLLRVDRLVILFFMLITLFMPNTAKRYSTC